MNPDGDSLEEDFKRERVSRFGLHIYGHFVLIRERFLLNFRKKSFVLSDYKVQKPF
jgi:hypothetical protein